MHLCPDEVLPFLGVLQESWGWLRLRLPIWRTWLRVKLGG